MKFPSIFNDVIGPVMRGPSSSHCAAALRIGRIARDLMGGEITNVRIQFDPNGSLATTHASQGSDMGIFGGLLGWDAIDERLVDSEKAITTAGIQVNIEIVDIEATHPNTYKICLGNSSEQHEITAISCGGGMIQITNLDSYDVSILGDYFETLLYFDSNGDKAYEYLSNINFAEEILIHQGLSTNFIEVKATDFITAEVLSVLLEKFNIRDIKKISPVDSTHKCNDKAVKRGKLR